MGPLAWQEDKLMAAISGLELWQHGTKTRMIRQSERLGGS
jgi:hypothetical protein